MRILITGNPRSGTKSMSRMLTELGFDVPHEAEGKDGVSSCFYIKPMPKNVSYPREKSTAWRHPNERFNPTRFDTIIHLVRDPLDCIPSMVGVVGTGHQQWLDKMGIVSYGLRPKLLWAMKAWLASNLCVEELVPTQRIHIEDVPKDWIEGFPRPHFLEHVNRSTGYCKRERTSWEELSKLDEETSLKIHRMAVRYGYRYV